MSTTTKRYVLKITLSTAIIAAVITLTCGCSHDQPATWLLILDTLWDLGTVLLDNTIDLGTLLDVTG